MPKSIGDAMSAAAGAHQPGQDTFRAIRPEEIEWKPFPAFPPAARLAILIGQPSQPGPYTIRVKMPNGEKMMPHRHPEDRVYTVISGVFYIRRVRHAGHGHRPLGPGVHGHEERSTKRAAGEVREGLRRRT